MNKAKLLWVDDEIELLRSQIIFLEQRGYEVEVATNAQDAIEMCGKSTYDLLLLDENMPGLSGLDTIPLIKEIQPDTPIVMVTKSEEENIMEDAIGRKIADYLIKPVNPHQILLSLKKNIHSREIVSDKTTINYQQAFRNISIQTDNCSSLSDFMELYKQLVAWELELVEQNNPMQTMLQQQKTEANAAFGRFIKKNYQTWLSAKESSDRPLMSPDLFKNKLFPLLDQGEKLFFILIDNFRLDQWRMVKSQLNELFIVEEDLYTSILPTATQYARNAIFSGLMPLQIAKMFPSLWVDEESEEGKNLNEQPMIQSCLDRYRKRYSFTYTKVNDNSYLEKMLHNFSQFTAHPLNVVVLNFVDMLSHARTEVDIVRQMASSEAAYRSLTQSWMRHSAVAQLFELIAQHGYKVVLTTDHGSIRVSNPQKVVGLKDLTTNLRYKMAKVITYDTKNVFEIKQPEKVGLPSPSLASTYIFALNNDFFAYPNNYNHYVSYYRDTFQHGGISMEEMLIPLVTLSPKAHK